jgi:hypothetical protein
MKTYTPQRHYFIKVNQKDADTFVTENGMELMITPEEGDQYQSKPFHGELMFAPKNSRIPIGETVYMNYKAQEELHKVEGEDMYIIKDDLIVAWGEDMQAYKCVTLQPEYEKIESDVLLLPDYLFEDQITTSGKILSSDNEWFEQEGLPTFEKDDEITYSKNLDWEYIVNRKKYYYIQWVHYIFEKNGELINDYNELGDREEWIERNGIRIPNDDRFYDVQRGKFKDKRILPNVKRIELDKYIKNEEIFGHLTA